MTAFTDSTNYAHGSQQIFAIDVLHNALATLVILAGIVVAVTAFGLPITIVVESLLVVVILYLFLNRLIRSWIDRLVQRVLSLESLSRSHPTQDFLSLLREIDVETDGILKQFAAIKSRFASLRWLCPLPTLLFVPHIADAPSLINLLLVQIMLVMVGTSYGTSLLSATVPFDSLARLKHVNQSINRGTMSTPVIASFRQLLNVAERLLPRATLKHPPLVWGMVPIRDKVATEHFFVHGEIGSGKSIVLKHLLGQVIKRATRDSDQRILIDDPKQDMVAFLEDSGTSNYRIINPFDERGNAWDIAADIQNKRQIDDFALMLIPEGNHSDPYWPRAARSALTAILLYFVKKAPKRSWTLRDLLLAIRFPDYVREIAMQSESGRSFVETYAIIEKTFVTLLSELQNELQPLESLAAAMHVAAKQGRLFSIRDWVNRIDDRQVLVLTRDPDSDDALDRFARMLMYFLCKAALKGPEVKHPRTWLFVDEARLLADLPQLSKTADEGRSKGMTLCLATQSHVDFVESAKRNTKAAPKFAARIPNKILLKTTGEDAVWSAEQFDKIFRISIQQSTNYQSGPNGGSHSHGTSQSEHQTYAVPPHAFIELPKPSIENGMQFYVVSDPDIGGGFWTAHMPSSEFPPAPRSDPSLRWLDDDLVDEIEPWARDDLVRLGLVDILAHLDLDFESKEGASEGTSQTSTSGDGSAVRPEQPKQVVMEDESIDDDSTDVHHHHEDDEWEDGFESVDDIRPDDEGDDEEPPFIPGLDF